MTRSRSATTVAAFATIFFVAAALHAQPHGVRDRLSSAKGPVNTIDYERVYVRFAGRNVGEKFERLGSERYDADRRILEYIEFGNGFLKARFEYQGDRVTSEVGVFDPAGNPMRESDYKPVFDAIVQTDLCPQYVVRREDDAVGKIERLYEICLDGSARATTITEFDQNGKMVRSVRTDARSRKWEEVHEYSDGNLTEYRITISGVKAPYTHTVRCSDHKYDERGNWIRMTVTTFVSTHPDVLAYQYNEYRRITYYSDTPASKKK